MREYRIVVVHINGVVVKSSWEDEFKMNYVYESITSGYKNSDTAVFIIDDPQGDKSFIPFKYLYAVEIQFRDKEDAEVPQ